MNGDIGGQNNLAMINPDNIERIEIVKGASSSLYGSDAIAGVINIITKKNRDPFNVTNKTRVGCYGDIMRSNSIGNYFDYTQIETTDDFDESIPPKRLTYYPGISILQTSQRKFLTLAKGVFHLGEQHILENIQLND